MTCQEFKELAASYALGALDAEERTACDAHLAAAEHDGCREALAQAEEVAAALPLALPPVKPPPELWGRISAQLGGAVRPIGSAPRRSRAPWVVAAAGWMAAAASLAGIVHYRDRVRVAASQVVATRDEGQREVLARAEMVDRCRRELEGVKQESAAQQQAIALLEQPDTRVIALAPQGGAAQRATAILHRETGKAVIVGQGLVAQPGKDYELWVIKGEEKLPAGLLHAGDDGRITMIVDASALAKGVDAFAITLEPAGGGPVPRGDLLLVGKV